MKALIQRVIRKMTGTKPTRRSHRFVTPLPTTGRKYFVPVETDKSDVHTRKS